MENAAALASLNLSNTYCLYLPTTYIICFNSFWEKHYLGAFSYEQ